MEAGQTILISLITGCVPATLLWLLNRKGANTKLKLDEGGLSVTQFNAQTAAYQDLLDRSNKALAEALTELKSYKSERAELNKRVENQGNMLERLRELFTSYVTRVGIPMTEEELAVFESTKPKRKVWEPK